MASMTDWGVALKMKSETKELEPSCGLKHQLGTTVGGFGSVVNLHTYPNCSNCITCPYKC